MSKSLDQLSKEIFSFNRILTYILKACILEFKDINVEDISYFLHSNNPYFDPANNNSKVLSLNTVEVNNKTIYDTYYPVSLPDSDGKIAMFVNVEAQGYKMKEENLRARQNVYISRMIEEQRKALLKTDYSQIKKIVSCWIFPNTTNKKRKGKIILEPRIQFDYTEGRMNKMDGVIDDTTLIASIYLGESNNPTIQLLNYLYDRIHTKESIQKVKKEYGIEIEEEITTMCTLEEAIRENERLKTEKIARQEGIKTGKESMMISNLKNLMEKLNVSLEDAMNLLNVSAKDKKKYMNLML